MPLFLNRLVTCKTNYVKDGEEGRGAMEEGVGEAEMMFIDRVHLQNLPKCQI